nr:PREDICTED: alpha-1,3-mannosyl-glycoprotein 4-beta-N-acetylglucosaminyltransferase C-like isoform X2 [Struthio camelus australis]
MLIHSQISLCPCGSVRDPQFDLNEKCSAPAGRVVWAGAGAPVCAAWKTLRLIFSQRSLKKEAGALSKAPARWPGAMRCSLKRFVTAALAAASLLLLLFLFMGNWCGQNLEAPLEVELRGLAPDMVLHALQQDRVLRALQDLDNVSAPLNVSNYLLAGSPPPNKKFLTVGMASVQRPRGYYLRATLQSIFEQSTEEELQEMVVVVHLADTDPGWNARVAADIARRFFHHLHLGRLLLIHAPHEFYPTLDGLKRNYNDPEERVRFRSKQNVDYAFLLAFAANLSTYYLMIEDDVRCSRSFLTAIRKTLASWEGSNWVTLEFSKLGYIGKLYHSSDLPRLARFLLLFYQEMPCDWLLSHFRLLLTQKDVIRFKPSLFQHVGFYSSFQGTINRLEDDDFEADALDLPDNPPAALFTDMAVFENYEPLKAYSTAEGYFWGKAPADGSVFCIIFQQPVRITRIRVRTGSIERQGDFLHAGILELGWQRRADGRDCSVYASVGIFEKGAFERQELEKGLSDPVECVRIRVTQSQSEWLIIQSIDIWTASST